MASDFVTALKAVLDRLDDLAASDEDLRARLQELARAAVGLVQVPEPKPAPPPPEPPPPAPVPAPPPPPPVVAPAPRPPVAAPAPAPRPLVIAPAPALAPSVAQVTAVPRPVPAPPPEVSLSVVVERCRLKAQAVRLAHARLAAGGVPRELGVSEYDLIARAKTLPDCYLWMLYETAPAADPACYHDLAGCYETAALTAELLQDVAAAPELFAQVAPAAAEAQSALRAGVGELTHRTDPDQFRLFNYLKANCKERQVYVHRHMQADDPADPTAWAAIRDRITRLRDDLRAGRDRSRKLTKQMGKVHYHAGRVAAALPAEAPDDWARIIDVADEMVRDGLPPSNVELREALLPVLDHLPAAAEVPVGFGRVLRELDRYLASRPAADEAEEDAGYSDEVRRAAELLRGRAVVLIGGEKRPHAKEALEAALGLSELVWLEGQRASYTVFEPYVARPDVAVVVLAIRWSSHGYSEVKEYCDRFGKPLVRLTGGYNPNQVAHTILSQTSGKLAAAVGQG